MQTTILGYPTPDDVYIIADKEVIFYTLDTGKTSQLLWPEPPYHQPGALDAASCIMQRLWPWDYPAAAAYIADGLNAPQ